MHINVSHILASEVGERADFSIEGENPNIPDLELSRPLSGGVRVTRLDEGIDVSGQVELQFRLECYRCLDPYEHNAQVDISGIYSLYPKEDEWPISGRGEIDLLPLLRQEVLVTIPIQQLCKQDCKGICIHCGQRLEDGHKHNVQESGHKPRLKKGQ